MKRRQFVENIALQAMVFSSAGTLWAMGENRTGDDYGVSSTKKKTLTKIGKRTPEEVRDIFKREFYEKTLPLWKKDGVDWEYCGYSTSLPVKFSDAAGWPYIDATGTIISTNKQLYHQGRILWLFSYFYNHIESDEYYLRAALVCALDSGIQYAEWAYLWMDSQFPELYWFGYYPKMAYIP